MIPNFKSDNHLKLPHEQRRDLPLILLLLLLALHTLLSFLAVTLQLVDTIYSEKLLCTLCSVFWESLCI